jgi:hypothetical protein
MNTLASLTLSTVSEPGPPSFSSNSVWDLYRNVRLTPGRCALAMLIGQVHLVRTISSSRWSAIALAIWLALFDLLKSFDYPARYKVQELTSAERIS